MAWYTTKDGKHINTDWFDKERQINVNKAEADERNTPIDVRNKNLRTSMPKTYKETSQNYYDKVSEKIKAMNINDLDINDNNAVVNKVIDILNKRNITGRHSCYRIAAGVAAILDKKGVEYKCFVGASISNPDNKTLQNRDKLFSNHVWVETKNNIYEYFEGQENNLVHLTITDELKFKKKGE